MARTEELRAPKGRRSVPSPEENLDLARRTKEGDREAAGELVIRNMGLVGLILARHYGHVVLPGDHRREDCDQEGAIAILKAAEKFDPAEGVEFSTYACYWIRQRIHDYLTRMRKGYRTSRHRSKNPYPSVTYWSDRELPSGLNPGLAAPEERDPLEREEEIEVVRSAVERLESKRDRAIITLRLGLAGRRLTLEEIGEVYSITRERVRQLEKRAMAVVLDSIVERMAGA